MKDVQLSSLECPGRKFKDVKNGKNIRHISVEFWPPPLTGQLNVLYEIRISFFANITLK